MSTSMLILQKAFRGSKMKMFVLVYQNGLLLRKCVDVRLSVHEAIVRSRPSIPSGCRETQGKHIVPESQSTMGVEVDKSSECS